MGQNQALEQSRDLVLENGYVDSSTTDRQRLRELARERRVHHLDNLAATLV